MCRSDQHNISRDLSAPWVLYDPHQLTSVSNGLEIDTGYLNKVKVHAERNRMTIGGAVTFEQAIEALYENGKEICEQSQASPQETLISS